MVVDSSLSEAAVDRLFHALSAWTRRDTLDRSTGSDQSALALARCYKVSLAAVQKHVAVLERAAFVTKERRGREPANCASEWSDHCKAIALLDQYEELWVDSANQIAAVLATPDEAR